VEASFSRVPSVTSPLPLIGRHGHNEYFPHAAGAASGTRSPKGIPEANPGSREYPGICLGPGLDLGSSVPPNAKRCVCLGPHYPELLQVISPDRGETLDFGSLPRLLGKRAKGYPVPERQIGMVLPNGQTQTLLEELAPIFGQSLPARTSGGELGRRVQNWPNRWKELGFLQLR
jgi:hypothetical protein